MTRDDVIRMAEEAGIPKWVRADAEELERFAAMVAAAEREACAKVAASHCSDPWKHDAAAVHVCDMVSVSIAAAIRARGGRKYPAPMRSNELRDDAVGVFKP